MVDTVIVENEQAPAVLSWPAVIAGAVVSAALSLALLALGSGIGFSAINPWATGPEPQTTKAATVAGIYLMMTAVIASAVGGYLAGRLRTLWPGVERDEVFFRDTAHGVVTWATATVASAAFLASVGTFIAGGAVTGGAAGLAVSSPMRAATADFTDRLFVPAGAAIARDYEADRSTANRLLGRLRVPGATLTPEERQSLATAVAGRTGLPQPEAERRVAAVEADARAAADLARRIAMQMSFWFVAAMLAGALASGLAAWEGGAIRDGRLRSSK